MATNPQVQSALILGLVVRLVAGARCPDCGTKLRATDVTIESVGGRTALACSGCHRDILVIEPKTSPRNDPINFSARAAPPGA